MLNEVQEMNAMTNSIETIEIKNFKQCIGREGYAWSCSLYINGKRAAVVSNDGNGGSNFYDFDEKSRDLEKPFLRKMCKMPAVAEFLAESEGRHYTPGFAAIDWTLVDIGFDSLIDAAEEKAWIKKQLRTKVLYRAPGRPYKDGAWSSIQHFGYRNRARAMLTAKYGSEIIFGGD